jgi:hypothetical protein
MTRRQVIRKKSGPKRSPKLDSVDLMTVFSFHPKRRCTIMLGYMIT